MGPLTTNTDAIVNKFIFQEKHERGVMRLYIKDGALDYVRFDEIPLWERIVAKLFGVGNASFKNIVSLAKPELSETTLEAFKHIVDPYNQTHVVFKRATGLFLSDEIKSKAIEAMRQGLIKRLPANDTNIKYFDDICKKIKNQDFISLAKLKAAIGNEVLEFSSANKLPLKDYIDRDGNFVAPKPKISQPIPAAAPPPPAASGNPSWIRVDPKTGMPRSSDHKFLKCARPSHFPAGGALASYNMLMQCKSSPTFTNNGFNKTEDQIQYHDRLKLAANDLASEMLAGVDCIALQEAPVAAQDIDTFIHALKASIPQLGYTTDGKGRMLLYDASKYDQIPFTLSPAFQLGSQQPQVQLVALRNKFTGEQFLIANAHCKWAQSGDNGQIALMNNILNLPFGMPAVLMGDMNLDVGDVRKELQQKGYSCNQENGESVPWDRQANTFGKVQELDLIAFSNP